MKSSSSAPYASMCLPTLHPHHVAIASACAASANTGMELRYFLCLCFSFFFSLFSVMSYYGRRVILHPYILPPSLMSFLFSLLSSSFLLAIQVFQCPLCKKTFDKRPDLQINRTLREITDQYKSMKSSDGVVRKKSGGKGGGGRSPSSHLFDELKRKLHRPVMKPHQAHSRSKPE